MLRVRLARLAWKGIFIDSYRASASVSSARAFSVSPRWRREAAYHSRAMGWEILYGAVSVWWIAVWWWCSAAAEPFASGEIGGELPGENLDGDLAAEGQVPGAIHLAHPSSVDGREDLVQAELVASGERHRRGSA